jgi:hypothetical protein
MLIRNARFHSGVLGPIQDQTVKAEWLSGDAQYAQIYNYGCDIGQAAKRSRPWSPAD